MRAILIDLQSVLRNSPSEYKDMISKSMSITDVLCMLYGLHTHMALLLAPSRMKQFSTVVALNLPFGLHRRIVDCVFSMSTIIRHSRAIVSLANATISSRGAQHGLAVLVTDAAFVETIICSASACLATDVYVESIGLVADVRCSIVGARNINHVELTTVTDVYRRWAIDRINTSRGERTANSHLIPCPLPSDHCVLEARCSLNDNLGPLHEKMFCLMRCCFRDVIQTTIFRIKSACDANVVSLSTNSFEALRLSISNELIHWPLLTGTGLHKDNQLVEVVCSSAAQSSLSHVLVCLFLMKDNSTFIKLHVLHVVVALILLRDDLNVCR